jgi:hypothetical protein
LQTFVGELVINSFPASSKEEKFIECLKSHNLLKKEKIFSLFNLLAYSFYLYNKVKVCCIWYDFKFPKEIEDLGKILDEFCDEKNGLDQALSKNRKSVNETDKRFLNRCQKELNKDIELVSKYLKIWERFLEN